tara:strand:+ start:5934 stop:6200 length:267 start_codon:yes stop_codon:yes gene_type:complete
MPKYDYNCSECNTQFELKHSYKFKDAKCIHCGSLQVSKIFLMVSKIVTRLSSHNSAPKVGKEVNKAITDGQAELEKTKKELKGKVYKK